MKKVIIFILFLQNLLFLNMALSKDFLESKKVNFKNKETHFKSAKSFLPNIGLKFQSSFEAKKNNLLKTPDDWSVNIPYIKIQTKAHFLESSFIETELNLFYTDQAWSFDFDNFFIQQKISFLPFISWRAGYFYYPVSYAEQNEKIFSKRNLMEKTLFLKTRRAMGLLFEGKMSGDFYWQISLQSPLNQRETDQVIKTSYEPKLSASWIYRTDFQKAFISYFQENYFLEGGSKALGLGIDLSHHIRDWVFHVKGEFWNIERHLPQETFLTYYIFPYLKWKKLSAGVLLGHVFPYYKKEQKSLWEYILKMNYFFNENVWVSIEKIKSVDSLIKESSWSFSLKTKFEM